MAQVAAQETDGGGAVAVFNILNNLWIQLFLVSLIGIGALYMVLSIKDE